MEEHEHEQVVGNEAWAGWQDKMDAWMLTFSAGIHKESTINLGLFVLKDIKKHEVTNSAWI
jgi:hypothetical protein